MILRLFYTFTLSVLFFTQPSFAGKYLELKKIEERRNFQQEYADYEESDVIAEELIEGLNLNLNDNLTEIQKMEIRGHLVMKSLIEILQTEHGENLFERAVAGELQNLGITSGSAIDKFFANFKTSKMEDYKKYTFVTGVIRRLSNVLYSKEGREAYPSAADKWEFLLQDVSSADLETALIVYFTGISNFRILQNVKSQLTLTRRIGKQIRGDRFFNYNYAGITSPNQYMADVIKSLTTDVKDDPLLSKAKAELDKIYVSSKSEELILTGIAKTLIAAGIAGTPTAVAVASLNILKLYPKVYVHSNLGEIQTSQFLMQVFTFFSTMAVSDVPTACVVSQICNVAMKISLLPNRRMAGDFWLNPIGTMLISGATLMGASGNFSVALIGGAISGTVHRFYQSKKCEVALMKEIAEKF